MTVSCVSTISVIFSIHKRFVSGILKPVGDVVRLSRPLQRLRTTVDQSTKLRFARFQDRYSVDLTEVCYSLNSRLTTNPWFSSAVIDPVTEKNELTLTHIRCVIDVVFTPRATAQHTTKFCRLVVINDKYICFIDPRVVYRLHNIGPFKRRVSVKTTIVTHNQSLFPKETTSTTPKITKHRVSIMLCRNSIVTY